MSFFLKPTVFTRSLFFIIIDILIFCSSLYIAYLLRFNFHIPQLFVQSFLELVWILVFIKITIFYLSKIYFITWRYFVLRDVRKILIALIISYIIFVLYLLTLYDGVFQDLLFLLTFYSLLY